MTSYLGDRQRYPEMFTFSPRFLERELLCQILLFMIQLKSSPKYLGYTELTRIRVTCWGLDLCLSQCHRNLCQTGAESESKSDWFNTGLLEQPNPELGQVPWNPGQLWPGSVQSVPYDIYVEGDLGPIMALLLTSKICAYILSMIPYNRVMCFAGLGEQRISR